MVVKREVVANDKKVVEVKVKVVVANDKKIVEEVEVKVKRKLLEVEVERIFLLEVNMKN